MTLRITLTALAALAVAMPAATQAQTIAALTGDKTIAIVDAKAGKITKTMDIDGIPGPILGIDVRPADGMLYAVSADGTVGTVDTATGKATMKVKLDTTLPAGVKATVDFNPVADRLRIIGSDGTNLRANLADGKVTKDKPLTFAEADANKGGAPMVVAGAYTNSVKDTKETALYDIDAKLGVLVKQAPPNDGVLNTVGSLGVKGDSMAFDIKSDGNGGNAAYLMAGDTLYTVDLTSGKATKAGTVAGAKGIRDIAILQ
jgi:WD40 repeat protein